MRREVAPERGVRPGVVSLFVLPLAAAALPVELALRGVASEASAPGLASAARLARICSFMEGPVFGCFEAAGAAAPGLVLGFPLRGLEVLAGGALGLSRLAGEGALAAAISTMPPHFLHLARSASKEAGIL
ncbi:MAG: hypothetical protein QF599_01420 [Planctomycetota bacterium]|nr:hypothetical protein [Planctomycetota bacterium]MDP6954606.1 hypothetical protein [Planctomycetota bacterium]